jgi:O-antigen/teichoic acid export membrane protein
MSKSGGIARGYLWAMITRLSLQAANMLALIVTSRLLSPADFGLFAPVIVIASVAYAVSDSAFGTALTQRQDIETDHIRAAFWMSLAAGLGLTATIALTGPLLEDLFGLPRLGVKRLPCIIRIASTV